MNKDLSPNKIIEALNAEGENDRAKMDNVISAVERAAFEKNYQFMDDVFRDVDISNLPESFAVLIFMATKPYKDKLQNRETALSEFKKAFFLKHPERCMGVFPYL